MKYVWLIATVLWFVFMTYLSHQNGNSTAETSLKLAEFLGDENLNGWLRKAAHVFLFFILAILFSLTLHAWDFDWYFVFLVSLWAIIDEWTKIFIDGRHFAWFDVGLNEIGSLIGIVVGMWIVCGIKSVDTAKIIAYNDPCGFQVSNRRGAAGVLFFLWSAVWPPCVFIFSVVSVAAVCFFTELWWRVCPPREEIL